MKNEAGRDAEVRMKHGGFWRGLYGGLNELNRTVNN